ncbi:MAG: hypothetical protein H6736_08990 [Alphaproteobacteria bacterium]|nr:hypothetical protein [Alphaproteobacteria bacterium]
MWWSISALAWTIGPPAPGDPLADVEMLFPIDSRTGFTRGPAPYAPGFPVPCTSVSDRSRVTNSFDEQGRHVRTLESTMGRPDVEVVWTYAPTGHVVGVEERQLNPPGAWKKWTAVLDDAHRLVRVEKVQQPENIHETRTLVWKGGQLQSLSSQYRSGTSFHHTYTFDWQGTGQDARPVQRTIRRNGELVSVTTYEWKDGWLAAAHTKGTRDHETLFERTGDGTLVSRSRKEPERRGVIDLYDDRGLLVGIKSGERVEGQVYDDRGNVTRQMYTTEVFVHDYSCHE